MPDMTVDNSWWHDRPVFITGCTGFLGQWLTRALTARGAQVIGLVRDQAHDISASVATLITGRVITVQGDVRERGQLERILNEYEVQTVFHLAAQALVGAAQRDPTTTFDINIGGTWSLLEAARCSPTVKQVIISSSDRAYGTLTTLPYTEAMPLRPDQPYDVSKACMDLIARTYAHTYGLPVGVTRCSNLYGGGDLNWNRIVPGTIRAALTGTAPEIRSNGTLQRDYLYVEDAVHAYLTLAQALDANPTLSGKAFNFGSGQPVSVLEMVRQILQVADCDHLQPVVLGQASHETPTQYLDNSQAARCLAWQPQYTLEAGLRATVEWYRCYIG